MVNIARCVAIADKGATGCVYYARTYQVIMDMNDTRMRGEARRYGENTRGESGAPRSRSGEPPTGRALGAAGERRARRPAIYGVRQDRKDNGSRRKCIGNGASGGVASARTR